MLFADVSFTTESVVAISGLLTALSGAVVFIFKLLMKSKDDQLAMAAAVAEKRLKDEESQKKSYKEIAMEAVAMAEFRANREREAAGRPPIKALAGVVPEHNSPVTQEQHDTAELQTLRARVTAVGLSMDIPPREAGPPVTILPPKTPIPAPISMEKLKADVDDIKRGQVQRDLADLKDDVAEVPEKTAKRIEDGGPNAAGKVDE